jgi:hypothetical protein
VDLALLALVIVVALAAAVLLKLYRSIKSLEALIYPMYASLLWIRVTNASFVDALVAMLGARGVISAEEEGALRAVVKPGNITDEDLDRLEELMSKRPEELSPEEVAEVRRIALSLLAYPSRSAVKLAAKLLAYISRTEKARAEKAEVSYIAETCTIRLYLHSDRGSEVLEEADRECVADKAKKLKELARRRSVEGAEDALRTYALCKERQDAGCRALMSELGSLEKKALDLLLNG